MANALRLTRSWWLRLFLLACALASTAAVAEEEMTLKVQLIWGTNDEKPESSKLKEVNPKLIEKLAHFFKWKNYFKVNEEVFTLPQKGEKKLTLSDKCEVIIRDLNNGEVEVELIGKKVTVKKQTQSIMKLKEGGHFVYAGDDKEKWGDAWFIVLSMPTK